MTRGHSAIAIALGLFAFEDAAGGYWTRAAVLSAFALSNAAIAFWVWRHS